MTTPLRGRAPLLLLLALTLTLTAAARAQTPDPCATAPQSCATMINTHASATGRIPNTAADIMVAISVSDKDLASAQRALAERSTALLSYLRGEKVQRLLSSNVTFSPDLRPQKNGPEKTVGYLGNASVSFRTTPAKAPELLAGVLAHGADQIASTNFTPTEEEIAAARRELAGQATRDAIAEAESIAKAAGLHMVALRSVNVGGDLNLAPRMGVSMRMQAATAEAAPIDTSPGDQSLSMRVDLTSAATR